MDNIYKIGLIVLLFGIIILILIMIVKRNKYNIDDEKVLYEEEENINTIYDIPINVSNNNVFMKNNTILKSNMFNNKNEIKKKNCNKDEILMQEVVDWGNNNNIYDY